MGTTPICSTSRPPATLARRARSKGWIPAAAPRPIIASTMSPAPVMSYTSRLRVGRCSAEPSDWATTMPSLSSVMKAWSSDSSTHNRLPAAIASSIVRDRAARGPLRLEAVGRDGRRADEVATIARRGRIDDHRDPCRAGRFDQLPANLRRADAFAVFGNQDGLIVAGSVPRIASSQRSAPVRRPAAWRTSRSTRRI